MYLGQHNIKLISVMRHFVRHVIKKNRQFIINEQMSALTILIISRDQLSIGYWELQRLKKVNWNSQTTEEEQIALNTVHDRLFIRHPMNQRQKS